MIRLFSDFRQGDLVSPPCSFDLHTINFLRSSPTLRRLENYHWPLWPPCKSVQSAVFLNILNFFYNSIQRCSHSQVNFFRRLALYDIRFVTVADKKLL